MSGDDDATTLAQQMCDPGYEAWCRSLDCDPHEADCTFADWWLAGAWLRGELAPAGGAGVGDDEIPF